MRQDALAGALNPIRRFWLTRLLPRQRRLDAETFGLVVERDRFLVSAKALGLSSGPFCGMAGSEARLRIQPDSGGSQTG